MMCLVTVRRLKPGSYDEFRAAWTPDPWPAQLERVEVLRNDDDPDQVMTVGYLDVTADELDAMRDQEEILEGEARPAGAHRAVRGPGARQRHLRAGRGGHGVRVVVLALAVLAFTAAPAAAKTCANPSLPGAGYFTSLSVKKTSCSKGKAVALAWTDVPARQRRQGPLHAQGQELLVHGEARRRSRRSSTASCRARRAASA